MLYNYIKIALRNLSVNRLYTFLNITGLAVGLAAGILVLLWTMDEFRYNRYHTNLSNIYCCLQNQTQGGVTYTFEAMPGPLAQAMRDEVPEIKRVARATWTGKHLLQAGEHSYYERGFFAEPDFLNIFTHPALKGDAVAALRDPNAVVLTERTAHKLFGNEDPIGKIVRHDNTRDLRVAAVVADVPAQSSTRFDVLFPFHIFEKSSENWIRNWGSNSLPMWVELAPGADVSALNRKLENFIQGKNPDAVAHAWVYPWERWRLYGKFEGGKQSGGRIAQVWLLGIIGLFVLLIACVNFMNLATARSERRAREVGVRKVMGAHRRLLIGQFLSEAMLMTFLGLVLAIVLARLALPGFNRFFDKTLVLDWSNWPLWSGVLLLGLLTGLVAGSYPAFFLSAFQPVRVLKNAVFSGRSSGVFRKALVTFQFAISILLIISTIIISRQISHVAQRPLGYEQENIIHIPARGDMNRNYETLKQELLQIPGVTAVTAASNDLITCGSNTSGVGWAGKTEEQDFLIALSWVRADWVKTTGTRLVEGRDFDITQPSDRFSCILNETAVRQMGLKSPVVGTTLTHDTTLTVVGVVADFIYNNPTAKPSPMLIMGGAPEDMSSFLVRFENREHWPQTIAQIERVSRKINPAYPFEFRFVQEEYQKSFDEIRSVGKLGRVFGGLAIFISALGLFGLSSFVAERRRKEIGVRKVLGASVPRIWLHLSSEFMRPVLIAFVVVTPLAAWLMEKLLSTLEYRIQLSWWMFAVGGLTAFLIAVLTVTFQSIRAALVNPARALKSE